MRNRPLAMVTGAAGALGTATVHALLAAGCSVLGVDRDAAVGSITEEGYEGVRADLLDQAAEATIRQATAGRALHHLIGIAGGALPGEPQGQDDPLSMEPELFRRSVEANLTTQFLVLQWVMPALRRPTRADRSVTLTSSFNALSAQGMPAYSAAKAGLIGMMHGLVVPLGREGIRINVVAPGTIRTPRTEALWGEVPGHFERLEQGTALGRLGTSEDVARANVALTMLTHVTGQVLVVDGGQSVVHR
ncbi:MAG TPA: SDR family oxidoreductase [Euzebya sp.]|nr:SDR family oxidoreductase [Euzebya sp.]